MLDFYYLHGFASSPQSSKAQFLADRLAAHGLTLRCPDLNQPDFSTITVTRMLTQVGEELQRRPSTPSVLIGSSLGAFVALHLAERIASGVVEAPPVRRLILLAPALDFGASDHWQPPNGGLAGWWDRGWLTTMHYGYGETRRVHYELYRDAGRYDSFGTTLGTPTVILQGRHDMVVSPAMVQRFAEHRPHVRLVLVDDDHQLSDSLDRLWDETAACLDLT